MPLVTAPNVIELSDFSGGAMPDLEPASIPPTGLIDALNMLPDIGSGTLQVRKGYSALSQTPASGFTVRSMYAYNRGAGTTTGNYLMLVVTNEDANTSNNVRLYAYDLDADTIARVDTGLTFPTATGRHWGATINGTYYGGGDGLVMYSWNPDDGFDADPSDQDYDTLVDVESGAPGAGQVGSDFAFENRQEVMYNDGTNTLAYSAAKKNRFKPWKAGTEYEKGDFVSVKTTIASKGTHMRSYKATTDHTAAAGNKPSVGAGHPWKLVELSLPRDEDLVISPDWNLIPTSAVTSVGMWHAERLWLRWDNLTGIAKRRVQYSAPSKPVKGDDTGQLEWDPRDFRVGDTESGEGEGGGWLPDFPHDVTAMYSFGYYGLFFTRSAIKVLAGTNENTWIFRELAPVGCIGPHAVAEHDGLVYFLSDRGLQMTDGTQVQEAPGGELWRDWFRESVNWETGGVGNDVHMWSYGGFVWMSLPTGKGRIPDTTLVYDPGTKSLWRQDLPIQVAAVNRIDGVDQLFFATPTKPGTVTESTAVYAWTGTENRSTSTRTLSAVVRTNLCTNPNFSVRDGVVLPGSDGAIAGALTGWTQTTPTKVVAKGHLLAGRQNGVGARVSNTRDPAQSSVFEGIQMSITDVDTSTHTVSCYIRRAEWKKNDRMDYGIARVRVGGTDIVTGDTTFEKVGNGWYRMTATYAGVASAREHAIVVRPNVTVDIDQVMVYDGDSDLPYFDGNGGAALVDHVTTGDGAASIWQYDHPDSDDEDNGSAVPWAARSAWLPFGVLREERRIRRAWSLVRGQSEVTFRGFSNFSEDVKFEAVDTPEPGSPAVHAEGLIMPDAHAVSFSVEGYTPSALLGIAVDTQPRRVRYHT